MAEMKKPWYKERAKEIIAEKFPTERTKMDQVAVEIKDDADVSCGTNPGGWVQCWIWVPDPVQTGGHDEGVKPQ